MRQLILDRFRAMVKEREEQRGEPLSGDEIVRHYETVLSELTRNSKRTIFHLTIIAGVQKVHAKGIADAICVRIIQVPVDQKLPSLYLLDSIVKKIGKTYIKYFSTHLPQVFCESYAEFHPNMHPAMRHLFGTWSAVFPSTVLLKIKEWLQFSPSVGQTSALNSLKASESPRPAHGIHVNPLPENPIDESNIKQYMDARVLKLLNEACEQELEKLKGIGKSRVAYIMERRNECQIPFKTLDDLLDIGMSNIQIQSMMIAFATKIFQNLYK